MCFERYRKDFQKKFTYEWNKSSSVSLVLIENLTRGRELEGLVSLWEKLWKGYWKKTEETNRDEFSLGLEKLPVSNSNLSWN
jgi:hypothetical protein